MEGEVRSHDVSLLKEHTEHIRAVFQEEVDNWAPSRGNPGAKPSLQFAVTDDYPVMKLAQDSAVIRRVEAAARTRGVHLDYVVAGGGSDANIFNSFGLQCAILSTGMDRVHSTRETIKLSDMALTAELVLAILT